jgi:DnaJ homologue, subfamily C, member 28, conserved domain
MSARKPPGLGWESWIDRQVREASERGEFDDLAGAGQPISNLDKPFDQLWWVKNKLSQEDLTYMSPSVALRKEAHDAREMALGARSEAEARRILAAINEKIRAANRTGIAGPPLMLVPYDIERVIGERRSSSSDRSSPTSGEFSRRSSSSRHRR